ncbi:MAG: hypothetical protein Fur0037_00320 [Planctomycetota bacterium]
MISPEHNETPHGRHHVVSSVLFVKVLLALLFLTFLTVLASRFDFGGASMVIAMGIASLKASLVISVFMHVWWDTAINKIFFLGSFLFLSLLFLFTLADLSTRGRDNPTERTKAPVQFEWVHPSEAKPV